MYKTVKEIQIGEELCISYGSNLWFDDADGKNGQKIDMETESFLMLSSFDTI